MYEGFTHHHINEAGAAACQQVEQAFDTLKDILDDVIDYTLGQPSNSAASRQKAIMLTELEHACFRAKKAICLQPRFQEAPERG